VCWKWEETGVYLPYSHPHQLLQLPTPLERWWEEEEESQSMTAATNDPESL
jgi:hypothetical protein